jgi:hypothetical protein
LDLLWPLPAIHGPSAKEAVIAVGIAAANFRNGTGPGIGISTGTASVIAAPAIIPGVILIARDRGSNQDSTGVITIARRTATKNSTGAITIARLTGTDINFGPGVIDRSTGIIAPDGSTGDRTIRW